MAGVGFILGEAESVVTRFVWGFVLLKFIGGFVDFLVRG